MADNQMDSDAAVLEDANAAVLEIDIRYREADINGKIEIASTRDQAYARYSQVRLNLLQAGMLSQPSDVTEMRAIRQQVERAANQQQLIIAAGRLLAFLAKFV